MLDPNLQTTKLQEKIRELEEKIEHLRLSRRVLMNMIERIERTKTKELQELLIQNKKLQKNNLSYAKKIIVKNRLISELEAEINSKISNNHN